MNIDAVGQLVANPAARLNTISDLPSSLSPENACDLLFSIPHLNCAGFNCQRSTDLSPSALG